MGEPLKKPNRVISLDMYKPNNEGDVSSLIVQNQHDKVDISYDVE